MDSERLKNARKMIQGGARIGLDLAVGVSDAFPGPANATFVGIKAIVDLVDVCLDLSLFRSETNYACPDQQFKRNEGDWKELKVKLEEIADIFVRSLVGYEPNAVPNQLINNISTMEACVCVNASWNLSLIIF